MMVSSTDHIVVTGGLGFLGSAVIWGLNELGFHNITIVDRFDELLELRKKNISHLKYAEIIDAVEFLSRISSGGRASGKEVAMILHFGSCSDSMQFDASTLREEHSRFSKIYATWAMSKEIPFMYSSSASTYGDSAVQEDMDLKILSALQPKSAYAITKHEFDLWMWRQGYLSEAVAIKPFNIFGPNEYHKRLTTPSFILKAFDQASSGGPITLFRSTRANTNDGMQQRDFLYVKDFVRAVLVLVLGDWSNIPKGIYNIGSGESLSMLSVATLVSQAVEPAVGTAFVDPPAALAEVYQYYTRAEVSKLMSAGWDGPDYKIELAVSEYYNYYYKYERRL